jgi:ribosome-interacting GTPase 1
MPANLTPEFIAARERFQAAEAPREKLAALEEMYAVIPKHKGTEHMRMDIKRRMSKLKQQMEQERRKGGKHGYEFHVPPEGAGQVVLIGAPNAGKSELLGRLTSAAPEVAAYPFTTRTPLPGMMEYEDIQIQLLDTPPIARDFIEPWLTSIVRAADAILLVADLSSDSMMEDVEAVTDELATHKTRLAGPDEGEDPSAPYGTACKRTLVVGNKLDLPEAVDNLEILRELYGDRLPIAAVSASAGAGLEDLKEAIYRLLDIVRVYTKQPGKPPEMHKPFTLPRGSTVIDVARAVHRDFPDKLRFARAWGTGKPDGAMAGRDQVVEDGDVIELHV